MWQKFILGVPIDRLVKQYPLLNKKTMPSSIMKLGKRLREFMEYKENNAFELSKNNVLYIDETTHPLTYSPQKSDGKTRYSSYIYCLAVDKIILFKATISRSSKWLRDKLKELDYDIYISSDDYSGYNFIKDNYHLLCNRHARRNFFKAVCSLPKDVDVEASSSYQVLLSYSKIFRVEKKIKVLSSEDKYKYRNSDEYQKLIEDLWNKVEIASNDAFGGSKTEKAVKYIKNNWNRLFNYRKSGDLKMENGTPKNNIKKLCLIRNNSLIFNNANTAQINCDILSLILIAKAYGLDERKYLNYIFQMLPDLEDEHKINKRKDERNSRPVEVNYEQIAPWNSKLYNETIECTFD